MKIIDGKNLALGRLSSYVAKELLKGEEIVIINCEEVVITGSKRNIQENYQEKRTRHGSSRKGPHPSKVSERIVKNTIRGMLPNYREGRGREAFKKVKCYNKVPKEFEGKDLIVPKFKRELMNKSIKVKEISKHK
jgi:large subunit ribosomal protein L13